jgi:hypothetical protein
MSDPTREILDGDNASGSGRRCRFGALLALMGGGGSGCDQDLWTEICPKQVEWLHHRRASNTSAVRGTWD